jgi:hypothetical protein
MLVTDSKKIYDEVNQMKTFYNDGRYFHPKVSFNYRMPNAQAKLAIASLKKFKGKDWVKTKLFDTEHERDAFIKENPKCRTFFKPMSSLPMYKQKIGKNALRLSRLGAVIPQKH